MCIHVTSSPQCTKRTSDPGASQLAEGHEQAGERAEAAAERAERAEAAKIELSLALAALASERDSLAEVSGLPSGRCAASLAWRG